MSDSDKFAWLRAIRDDDELSDGEKYVLQNVALWYSRYGEDVVHVRQATAAELLKVSIRLVKKAYAEARRLGYFALESERERGRSGKSDSYRLVVPAQVGAQSAPQSGSRCTERPEYVHETTEVGARAEAPTSANATPKGFYKGLNKGYGAGPTLEGSTGRRPRSDAKSLADIVNRSGPTRQSTADLRVAQAQALKHSSRPAMSPVQQAAIEASRKNLDRAEQQARHEETA